MRTLLTLLTLVIAMLASGTTSAAPKRSVAVIAWAIGQANSSLSKARRTAYAKALKRTAEKNKFDPFTGVAIIWHESHWRSGAIGDSGEAIGLAQIHYRYLCKKDATPARCESVRQRLLNGLNNIRVMGDMISTIRRYCRRVTGKPALFARWLHAYGFNQRKNLKCNMRKTNGRWRDRPVPTELRWIIQCRKQLIRKLQRRRKSRRKGRR